MSVRLNVWPSLPNGEKGVILSHISYAQNSICSEYIYFVTLSILNIFGIYVVVVIRTQLDFSTKANSYIYSKIIDIKFIEHDTVLDQNFSILV